MANPVFMSKSVMIPLLIGVLIIAFLIYKIRKVLILKQLLYLGTIIPILFWIITLISGHIHGNYVQYKNTISELGAIGRKARLSDHIWPV